MFRLLSENNINYKQGFRFQNPVPKNTVGDPYLANVVLNLKMDGANGGTTFTDSGSLGLTVTRVGTSPPTISTAQSKYGGSSGLFLSSQSYLSANDANLALGTENFTIEYWGYKTSVTSVNDGAFGIGTTNANFSAINSAVYNGNLYAFVNEATGDAFPANQWNHVALVREGTGTNQSKVYLNGVLVYTTTFATNLTHTFVNVGAYSSAGFSWDGYLDSFRVTKGIARYTANFNPETDTFLAD